MKKLFRWLLPVLVLVVGGLLGLDSVQAVSQPAVAEATIKTTLSNNGWWWQTQTVTLPPDTNQQRVWIESLSPRPQTITLDPDGNILARYRLRPKQTIEVTATALISTASQVYNLDLVQELAAVPPELKDTYGQSTGAWANGDTSAVAADMEVPEAVKALYQQAIEQLKDAGEVGYEQTHAAANKLVAGLRAYGLPARVVLGQKLNAVPATEPGQSWAWIEAYLPGVGWITLDPADPEAAKNFGRSNDLLVGLVLRGVEDDFPPEQLAATQIAHVDRDPPEVSDPVPELVSTKFVLLPGLALHSTSLTMPVGVIVDDTAVVVDGRTQPLGSLAPLQTVTVRQFAVLGEAFSGGNVAFGFGDSTALTKELTTASVTVSYLIPMILGGLLALVLVVWLVRRFRSRRQTQAPEPQIPEAAPLKNKDATMSVDELREQVRQRVADEQRARANNRNNSPRPPLIQ